MWQYAVIAAVALAPCDALRLGRRQVLVGAGAGTGLLLPPLPAALADEAIERVIPVATLLASLATAPARDIVITGSNSGVGLAGAKLLVAAGHRVTLACRTQEKAEKAAEACTAFAATNPTREGVPSHPPTTDPLPSNHRPSCPPTINPLDPRPSTLLSSTLPSSQAGRRAVPSATSPIWPPCAPSPPR